MLAAAEVASQGPPGFQVGDAIALLGRVDHSDRRSPPGSPFDGDRADQAPRAEARPAHRLPGQDGQHSACPLHCFSATNARGAGRGPAPRSTARLASYCREETDRFTVRESAGSTGLNREGASAVGSRLEHIHDRHRGFHCSRHRRQSGHQPGPDRTLRDRAVRPLWTAPPWPHTHVVRPSASSFPVAAGPLIHRSIMSER